LLRSLYEQEQPHTSTSRSLGGVRAQQFAAAGRCFLLHHRLGVKIFIAVSIQVSPQGAQQTPFKYVLLNLIVITKTVK